jgi:hypothetical protein
MRGYDFHPEAEIDLDAIWEFIAEDNQVAADRMSDRRPDLSSRPLRFTNAGNYLIAYAPDKKPCGSSRSCMDAGTLA